MCGSDEGSLSTRVNAVDTISVFSVFWIIAIASIQLIVSPAELIWSVMVTRDSTPALIFKAAHSRISPSFTMRTVFVLAALCALSQVSTHYIFHTFFFGLLQWIFYFSKGCPRQAWRRHHRRIPLSGGYRQDCPGKCQDFHWHGCFHLHPWRGAEDHPCQGKNKFFLLFTKVLQ